MIISFNKTAPFILMLMLILITTVSIVYISSIMDDIDTNNTDCCSCKIDL